MRRRVRFLLILCVGILIGAFGIGVYRNPETATLDEAARAGVSGKFVTLSPGVTHYDIAGPDSGRTVVLVHGFSVPYYIWDSTSAGLSAAGYRVIRFDTYGRGYSDRPDVTYDGALTDTQIAELLDSLGVTGPVDLVGLSWGGWITAHFTASHPARVRTLTLIDPAAGPVELPTHFTLPIIGPWFWQVIAVAGMAEGQMSDFLHPERYPSWVAQYRPQMQYKGFGRALLSTLRSVDHTNLSDIYRPVGRLATPVLLVWGRQDQTVSFENSATLRQAMPQLKFAPIDSAGHVANIEQAQRVNARMIEFFEEHPATTAP